MACGVIVELHTNSIEWTKVIEEVEKLEKMVFPIYQPFAPHLDKELNNNNYGLLYSQIDGEFAGYVMFSWSSSLSAVIAELAVKENYRRQGHGEALLKAAIQKCRTRNVQRISLHVDPMRMPAMNLYKKLGFQVDYLIEGYYSQYNRDAYLMHLDFEAE